jgi:hypothetical protein
MGQTECFAVAKPSSVSSPVAQGGNAETPATQAPKSTSASNTAQGGSAETPATQAPKSTSASNSSPNVVASKALSSPALPAIAAKLKNGKTFTIAAKKGTTTDGLVIKVSTKSKTCSVTKTSAGFSVKGKSAGSCALAIAITGNASFRSLSTMATVKIIK